MYEIENIEEIGKRNQTIVNKAKEHFNNGFLTESKELFEESLEICIEQNWEDGIAYANDMLDEIDRKQESAETLRANDVLVGLHEPLERRMKKSKKSKKTTDNSVMVNMGSENHPYLCTTEEREVIKRFCEENPNKKAIHLGNPTKTYLKWKNTNIVD